MFLWHLLFAMIIGFLVTTIFVFGFRRTGPWSNIAIFFIIVFLAAWAGGLWITPIGPTLLGIYWLPFLLVAFLFALILVATTIPSRPPQTREEAINQAAAEVATEDRLGIFFWILIVTLILVIIAGYYFAI